MVKTVRSPKLIMKKGKDVINFTSVIVYNINLHNYITLKTDSTGFNWILLFVMYVISERENEIYTRG